MTGLSKTGAYFWILNVLVVIAVAGVSANAFFSQNDDSPYRAALYEVPHYVTMGFATADSLTGALEFAPGRSAGAGPVESAGHIFMVPGERPYKEFTITARFSYLSQYDELAENTDVVPGLMLPGLGDNYEIYLNGHLIASEWHVENGEITVHKLARSKVYPINPGFLTRGRNTLVYRVYGDPTAVDTGLTVTGRYVIDDLNRLKSVDTSQIIFGGICLAVAVTFMVYFLLYREKTLNLWFSVTALSISLYAFFRAGSLQGIFPNYAAALRLEVISLFTFAFFITVLVYTCNKTRFNTGMKVYTGIYAALGAAVLLPGHQFVLDTVKVFFVLFVPFVIYAFISSLLIPLIREVKIRARTEDESLFYALAHTVSGTLRGNMLIGAFIPILLALFDQLSYVVLSYQEVVLSQYGFLFFFANVTYALASDNAAMQNKLLALSNELRTMVSERESQLARKSDEVEEAKSAQLRFRESVSREIRAPLGEMIGSIELRMLRAGLSADAISWLTRMLDIQRGLRAKLDHFLGEQAGYESGASGRYSFDLMDARAAKAGTQGSPGGTRHLFVINPKSFVTLRDLKNFLLSIEKCFSAGHRAEYKIYISRYPRDAYSAVHRYLSATPAEETARVYSVGGDGILFDCLNGLAKFPNAELAPIPYGNANDFARAFGAENMALFRDIKLMSTAPSRLVDVIVCGQQYALCSCSIGIEAKAVQVFSHVIEKINSGKARNFVPLLYVLGAVKSLFDGSQNNMSYQLSLDGTDVSGAYQFVNCGNIALNGGGNVPNPYAMPDDGILDVITCKSSSAFHSLRMLPAYTAGRFDRYPGHLTHHRVKELRCESQSLMSVILDGETFYTHGLELKILPKAVKIVSPHGIGFADYSSSAKGAV